MSARRTGISRVNCSICAAVEWKASRSPPGRCGFSRPDSEWQLAHAWANTARPDGAPAPQPASATASAAAQASVLAGGAPRLTGAGLIAPSVVTGAQATTAVAGRVPEGR